MTSRDSLNKQRRKDTMISTFKSIGKDRAKNFVIKYQITDVVGETKTKTEVVMPFDVNELGTEDLELFIEQNKRKAESEYAKR